MKSQEEIRSILERISFRDWTIRFEETNGVPWIQAVFKAPDVHTGVVEEQKSGKTMLSYHMCENEIVRKVYKTIKGAIEHELDEEFRFDQVAIFNPHMNYSDFVNAVLCGTINEDNRL